VKILNEFINKRDGNDCLIITGIMLIEVERDFYIVISTEKFLGSWTGNTIETNSESFNDYNKALSRYNHLVKINDR
jgi:hypothetical protein